MCACAIKGNLKSKNLNRCVCWHCVLLVDFTCVICGDIPPLENNKVLLSNPKYRDPHTPTLKVEPLKGQSITKIN